MVAAKSNVSVLVGPRWARVARDLVATVLLGSLLPGCPLSDDYFVDRDAGIAGSKPATRAAGGGAVTSAGSGAGARAGSSAATIGGGGGGGKGSGGTGLISGSGGAAGMTSTCITEAERCDGISNDCDAEIDEDSVCPTGCSAKRYDEHVYVLCASDNTASGLGADAAVSRCTDLGVQFGLELGLGLAWVESSAENTFLKDWIAAAAPANAVVWMDANDQNREGTWVWGQRADAEQFFTASSSGGGTPYLDRFNDFAVGQPNGGAHDDEDCGAFDSQFDWQWSDHFCTTLQLGFVCEEHPAAP